MRVNLDDLSAWLKANDISREELAQKCNIKRSAIDGWFYRGAIPKTASAMIAQLMNGEKNSPENQDFKPTSVVALELTSEQFRSWNQAAMKDGKLITDWIIETVEEARKHYDELNFLGGNFPSEFRAAEEPVRYKLHDDDGGPIDTTGLTDEQIADKLRGGPLPIKRTKGNILYGKGKPQADEKAE